MSIVLDGSNGVTFPNGSNPQAAPSKVLQVVAATYNTQTSTTSSSFGATGFTATITPLFSTSKILLLSKVSYRSYSSSATNAYGGCSWFRGGNALQATTSYENGAGFSNATTADVRGITTQIVLDSPATTSAVTYTLNIACNGGTQAFYICEGNNFYSDVILMEIAA